MKKVKTRKVKIELNIILNTNIRPFIKKYGKNIDEVTSEHFIWYKEKETIELRYNGLNGNTGDTKNITVYMKKN